jgi:hypothetical protein
MQRRTRWKGWITLHRKVGSATGQPVAGSRFYEFELPGGPDQFDLAEPRLLRLWANEGSMASGPEALMHNDSSLTSYPNLEHQDEHE